jgi:L-gulonolactone oxidase
MSEAARNMSAVPDDGIETWGRVHHGRHQVAIPQRTDDIPAAAQASAELSGTTLALGLGRAYGDSALNIGGGVVKTAGLDRFLAFDRGTGVLRAEAGVSLDSVLRVAVPSGWFVPVTPGSKFVTLAGAIANDVHGKNHHAVGCFGRHVTRFGLWRSDRGALVCSPEENADLFAATIGGLGLTGIIQWVEIQLIAVGSAEMEVETERFENLADFFALSEAGAEWPYTVAWVDTLASGENLGRGVFSRGRHASGGSQRPHKVGGPVVPITPPGFLLNRWTVGAFNQLYYRKPSSRFRGRQHYDPFFYPLDRIRGWNRLYGPRGFYQWQCVVPPEDARAVIADLLRRIAFSGEASFLAVLKTFGEIASPGLLSFPMAGPTLALDFPNRGVRTLALLDALDRVVVEAGGRIYPAKDGRMSSATFQSGFANWRALEGLRDPLLSSSFWRRVTGIEAATSGER